MRRTRQTCAVTRVNFRIVTGDCGIFSEKIVIVKSVLKRALRAEDKQPRARACVRYAHVRAYDTQIGIRYATGVDEYPFSGAHAGPLPLLNREFALVMNGYSPMRTMLSLALLLPLDTRVRLVIPNHEMCGE